MRFRLNKAEVVAKHCTLDWEEQPEFELDSNPARRETHANGCLVTSVLEVSYSAVNKWPKDNHFFTKTLAPFFKTPPKTPPHT